MNKKIKLLTSTLCGVILASSLTFMNVQAAPAQNNVKTNISSLSRNSIRSLSPAISKDGVLYWTPQKHVTDYICDIYNQTGSYYDQHTGSATVGENCYTSISGNIFTDDNHMARANSTYKVVIRALDANRNVVNTATLYFYYDGTTYTQQ